MQLAKKTLAVIDDQLQSDSGNAFRGLLKEALMELSDPYRSNEPSDGFRNHMGASGIGEECARKIFFSFRWALPSNLQGRIVRLFNRGHLEEGRVVALLRMIGVTIHHFDKNGKQYRVSGHGGHFGGSGDGVGIGIPDAPDEYLLLEFKTISQKYFTELSKNGIMSYDIKHYVQMQIYMKKMGLKKALYISVNKNTDEIHAEIVELSEAYAEAYEERAGEIIFHKNKEDLPKRISSSPAWYKCKWCEYKAVCFKGLPPAINCRTCSNSIINQNGTWSCSVHKVTLDEIAQREGCGDYQREF